MRDTRTPGRFPENTGAASRSEVKFRGVKFEIPWTRSSVTRPRERNNAVEKKHTSVCARQLLALVTLALTFVQCATAASKRQVYVLLFPDDLENRNWTGEPPSIPVLLRTVNCQRLPVEIYASSRSSRDNPPCYISSHLCATKDQRAIGEIRSFTNHMSIGIVDSRKGRTSGSGCGNFRNRCDHPGDETAEINAEILKRYRELGR